MSETPDDKVIFEPSNVIQPSIIPLGITAHDLLCGVPKGTESKGFRLNKNGKWEPFVWRCPHK